MDIDCSPLTFRDASKDEKKRLFRLMNFYSFLWLGLALSSFLLVFLAPTRFRLMTLIGFFPATLLFMPVAMIYMGYKRILPMVCVTIGMNLFIWVLFVYSLKVRLPKGASFMSFLRFLYQ